MKREFVLLSALCAVIALSMETSSAQSKLRTPWGDPDLQGVWPSGQMMAVPFERPAELGTRATLTDTEYAQRVAEIRNQAQADATEFVRPGSAPAVNPPSHWAELPRASRQASLIVDPPNGRLPPMTEEGARRAKTWPTGNPAGGFADPTSFTPYERCISRGVLGSAFPNIYGTAMEIVQTPGYVVLRYEMVHETRIIPLDGRPHVSGAIRSWMGDSRGKWDRDTLVVETTNFNARTGSYARNGNGNPTSQALRLVERFTRRNADTLDYEVVVSDPQTWTRPWTVAFPLTADPGAEVVEYACHEGNYALPNLLKISRAAESSGK